MSIQYNDYIKNHKENVRKGLLWLKKHLPDRMAPYDSQTLNQIADNHDGSKLLLEEYQAYDDYFYSNNRSSRVVANFNKAWLHHIHANPHHWQHWVLLEDDAKVYTPKPIMMPIQYVLEMICDWWAFSWKSGNLYEIFDWWKDHEKSIILHPSTRSLVSAILEEMKAELNKEDSYGTAKA